MAHSFVVMCGILGLMFASACAKDDVIPVSFSGGILDSQPVASSLKVLVSDFEDERTDARRLGLRRAVLGSDEIYQVRNGGPGDATAKALAEYLFRKGWFTQYVGPGADQNGDVVISGKILELSLDSSRGLGTDIVAKSKLAIQARNQTDGSAITYTVSQSGTYSVLWFEEKDAEEIMRDVLDKSFEKFVERIKVDDGGLHFR